MVAKTKRRLTPRQRLAAVASEVHDSRAELREQRLRVELAAAKAKSKQYLADVRAADERCEVIERLAEANDYRELKPLRRKYRGQNSVVMLLSDWHYGEVVDPATINGKNAFNASICERRAERVFRWSAQRIEGESSWLPTKHLVIGLLGDFIGGYIHEELEESADASPTESVVAVKEIIGSGLSFLRREFKCPMDIVCLPGNHGRTTRKPRIATYWKNNYEWILYQTLASEFRKDSLLRWHIPKSHHQYLDIQGHTARFHHGDYVKYGGGRAGILAPLNNAIAEWNNEQVADIDFLGHFHQNFGRRYVHVNGSLKGYDAYAVSIKARFEPPSQSLIWVNRDRGNILAMAVECDEPNVGRCQQVPTSRNKRKQRAA